MKNKGSVRLSEKMQLLEELKRASPRKKSVSAKLNMFTPKKLLSMEGSTKTLKSEIKQLLRDMIEQNKELRRLEQQKRKFSDLDKEISLPQICDDSVDSSIDQDSDEMQFITMRDIPVPKESL